MSSRRTACLLLLGLWCLALAVGHPLEAYNSEEHKWIADLAVSAIEREVGQALARGGAGPVFFETGDIGASIRYAKKLAVGFETNNAAEYDGQAVAQDNYYWTKFRQAEYNKKIWIPEPRSVGLLQIPARVGSDTTTFSLGQLVALYGDYRRTTFCREGECYLTHWPAPDAEAEPDSTIVLFGKGTHPDYRPRGVLPLSRYLGAIGSGLVPPFGRAANAVSNTAGPTEYQEAGWWGDEMLRIANVNDWHFSKAAVAWYVGMHRLALYYSGLARKNPRYWVHAFHHEASALHSLTDLFAFGHVVTNRDRTAHGVLENRGLAGKPAVVWMNRILAIGGGVRNQAGEVILDAPLPFLMPGQLAETNPPQDEELPSYLGSWARFARFEQQLHDKFNKSGAEVYNLNGDKFLILGDGRLRGSQAETVNVMAEAVRSSIRDLLNFATGSSVGDMKKMNHEVTSHLGALNYIPVFIAQEKTGAFPGRWTLYADFVIDLLGSQVQAREDCKIEYAWGKRWRWPPHQPACGLAPIQ